MEKRRLCSIFLSTQSLTHSCGVSLLSCFMCTSQQGWQHKHTYSYTTATTTSRDGEGKRGKEMSKKEKNIFHIRHIAAWHRSWHDMGFVLWAWAILWLIYLSHTVWSSDGMDGVWNKKGGSCIALPTNVVYSLSNPCLSFFCLDNGSSLPVSCFFVACDNCRK